MYRIEIKWNREFHWSVYGYKDDLEEAKKLCDVLVNMGDGARVKAVRVVDDETEKVLYNR